MVSDLKTFTRKGCKIAAQKSFFGQFCMDQEVIQQGSGGYTTRIRRLHNTDQEVISRIILVSVLPTALVERCFVSRMRDFFQKYEKVEGKNQEITLVMCQRKNCKKRTKFWESTVKVIQKTKIMSGKLWEK